MLIWVCPDIHNIAQVFQYLDGVSLLSDSIDLLFVLLVLPLCLLICGLEVSHLNLSRFTLRTLRENL